MAGVRLCLRHSDAGMDCGLVYRQVPANMGTLAVIPNQEQFRRKLENEIQRHLSDSNRAEIDGIQSGAD